MVANMQAVPEQGLVHTEPNTKAFVEGRDAGYGTLWVTENVLVWKSSITDENMELTYPSITMHAICRDTNSFPFECIYCMLESSALPPADENEQDPVEMTEVRFVPDDKEQLKAIYEAIADCQLMHPDPDEDTDEFFGDEYYTSENGVEVELSEEGQSVLDRLTQNMQAMSAGEFQGFTQNGEEEGDQFEDADHGEQ